MTEEVKIWLPSKRGDVFMILTIAVVFYATAFLSFDKLVEAQLLSKTCAFIAGAIVCCTAVLLFRKRVEIPLDLLTAMIVLLTGYILLRMGLAGRFDLKFLLAAAFLLMYLFFKTVGNRYDDHIAVIIVLVCVLQAVYGLLQWAGVCYSGGFRMMGSFDNPAGIAALLSAGLPFCFSLTAKSKWWRYTGWISFGLISVAILLSGSRSGAIAATAVTGLFFIAKYKTFFKRHKTIFVTSAVLFCIISGTGLFYLKKDSAVGRLLIWETSAKMIMDKPVPGHGPGAFLADYMIWQADYFKNDPNSKYSQLADNVTHPFNEYLSLTVEYGIVGLLMLLVIAVVILCNVKKLTPEVFCILSIAVFSCFSYPMRYACVLLLLVYSLANFNLSKIKQVRLNIAVRIVPFLILVLLTFGLVHDTRFEYRWGQLVRFNSLGKTSELLDDYANLHKSWNGNPLFLYNYGAVLNEEKDYLSSNVIVSQCEKYYNDYDVQMFIADNYHNLSNWNKSLEHYELASLMCPDRFAPMASLMRIYITSGRFEEARTMANIIISKEIKIFSPRVSLFVDEARQFLETH